MINEDTQQTNLPASIAANRPHPLGNAVQTAQIAGGGNVSNIADRLAIENTPVDQLPDWLKQEAERKAAAQKAIDEANAATEQKLAAWQRYCTALNSLEELRRDVCTGEQSLARAQSTVANVQAAFDNWPFAMRNGNAVQIRSVVTDFLIDKEIVRLMPASLKKLREKITAAERDIAEMERTHGFIHAVISNCA